MYLSMNSLMEGIDSRFSLVILAAKRARAINDFMNRIKRHELTDIKAPELSMINEKPLSIAFSEISEGKLGPEWPKDSKK